MKIYNIDILSDIDLEMTPLTEDQEGNLRGGFVGIEGGAGIYYTNDTCENETCPNSPCNNNNCKNTKECPNIGTCANGTCANSYCPYITTATANVGTMGGFNGLIL